MTIGRKDYDTSKQDAAWVYYKLNDPNYLSYSDQYKVHVSFDQNKLTEASEIILAILFKYRIHHFKLIHSKAPDIARNVHGKELTIYLQKGTSKITAADEDQAAFWISVFNELEAKLISEKIEPNSFKPLADKLFPGSKGYISYRYPNNVLDRYIHALALKKCGFTINEAYNIGKDEVLENWFKGLALHHDSLSRTHTYILPKALPTIYKAPIQKGIMFKILKASILDRFMQNLSSNAAEQVFFGLYDKDSPLNQPHANLALKFKAIFGMNIWQHTALLAQQDPEYTKDAISKFVIHHKIRMQTKDATYQLKNYLEKCLDAAAQGVVEIHHLLDIPFSIELALGNITPAIYWHFFVPIATSWKSNPESNPSLLQTVLITEIIKAAFRDCNINQIDQEEPRYLHAINAYELDLYAIKFSRQFSPHYSTTARLALKGLPISQKAPKPDVLSEKNEPVKNNINVPDISQPQQQQVMSELSGISLK